MLLFFELLMLDQFLAIIWPDRSGVHAGREPIPPLFASIPLLLFDGLIQPELHSIGLRLQCLYHGF